MGDWEYVTALMGHDNEDKQRLKGGCWDREEIHGNKITKVAVKERFPRLARATTLRTVLVEVVDSETRMPSLGRLALRFTTWS